MTLEVFSARRRCPTIFPFHVFHVSSSCQRKNGLQRQLEPDNVGPEEIEPTFLQALSIKTGFKSQIAARVSITEEPGTGIPQRGSGQRVSVNLHSYRNDAEKRINKMKRNNYAFCKY